MAAEISSDPADIQGKLSVCNGETINFVGFVAGNSLLQHSYEFYATRSGADVKLSSRSDSPLWSEVAGNAIKTDDSIFVRIYNKNTASATATDTFSDSRKIEVKVNPIPSVILTNDVINNTFCTGEAVQFTALTDATGAVMYTFYLGNVKVKSSADNFYSSTSLVNNSVVRVEVTAMSSCKGSTELTMIENQIDHAGAIQVDGKGIVNSYTVCYNTAPPQLSSNQAASVQGSQLASSDNRYEWYSSLDNTNWEPINGANGESYQPLSGITMTTYFR